jgi:hypothetical protein
VLVVVVVVLVADVVVLAKQMQYLWGNRSRCLIAFGSRLYSFNDF